MKIDTQHCEGCSLQGVSEPTEVAGSPTARFMVVTDTPTKFNAAKGRLLSPRVIGVLALALQAEGFSKKDFLFVPQIRCPHNTEEIPTKELRAIQKQCREHLLDDIGEVRPECIIPLGAEPSRQVMGKAVKITKIRGVGEYVEEHKCTVLPLLSPGQVVMYPQHQPIFNADVATLRRLVDADYDVRAASESLLGDYEYIDDLEFLIEQEPEVLAFDTENASLEFFKKGTHNVRDYDPAIHGKEFNPDAAILTMQFSIEPGKAYMLVWDHPDRPVSLRRKRKLLGQLRRLLCNPNTCVVGQNLKYDNNYLYEQTGIRFKIGGDTLMLAALLDENMLSKSLDTLIKHYVPDMAGYADQFNATYDKSRMWEVPLTQLIGYGGGDADATFRLYHALWALVQEDERLVEHYRRVSLPALNVFAAVEAEGIQIDDVALVAFQEVMEESVQTQYLELMEQVPKSIKRAHIDKGLKFSRPDFTLDILFRHRDGFRLRPKVYTAKTAKLPLNKRVPSTSSKDHLPYFFDECPFTMLLSQYVKDERLLGTSIKGFKAKYIHDGLVRPTYSLHTTVTGRSSSENPNGQNTPKRGNNATAYRRMYVAPAGYYVLEADLSQAELRIAADMANDRTMLKIYADAGDIHTATALIVMGVTMEEFGELPKAEKKIARQKAKAVNFGFCIAAGQLVLTDTGLVPIEEVLDCHLVWDGVEWVHHGGLVCRGYQKVITHDGLTATPDHLVYAEGHSDPIPFGELASSVENRRAVTSGDSGTAIGVVDTYRAGGETREEPPILRVGMLRVQTSTMDVDGQLAIRQDYELHMYEGAEVCEDLPVEDSWAEVRCYGAEVREMDPYEFQTLQRTRDSGTVHIETAFHRVGINEVALRDFQRSGLRPGEQRRALLSREFTPSVTLGKPAKPGAEGSEGDTYALVYDLVDAGPRRRFTVSDKLVSNCYGMGWRKFIGYAKTQYGTEFTEEEAQRIRTAFFRKYSALSPWHEATREFAKRHGMVRSYSGRIRHLPMIDSEDEGVQAEAGRQAINSPVQEFASSLGLMAMGRMHEEIDSKYLTPIAFVHDAIYCYVPVQYAEWGAKTLKRYMESNPIEEWFGRRMKCPIVADVSIGMNFGDTYEMEGLKIDTPYDFSKLWDRETRTGLQVVKQSTPPNAGRLKGLPYSTP